MKRWVLVCIVVGLVAIGSGGVAGQFQIPNNDVVFNANQSIWMSTDVAALVAGLKGEGVVSGCGVSAQGSPDMTLAVAAGMVTFVGSAVSVSAGNVTITTANSTNPRIDLVSVNSSGTKAVTAGTASANPAPPAIPSNSILLAMVYVPAADTAIAGNQITDKRVILNSAAAAAGVAGGRLTTETGVPVSTTDRTAQSTVYYTPFTTGNGPANAISVYDGVRWKVCPFSEISQTLSSLTSGKNYDEFLYDATGTCGLALELSAAWTSDTARSDPIAQQDGIDVKSSDHTRRLVGTIRTTGTTTTADSRGGTTTQVGGQRFVWSRYNQVPRPLDVIDTTDTWAYTTGTMRQANGATGNKVEYVAGTTHAAVIAELAWRWFGNSNSARAARSGIGIDSTTTISGHAGSIYNPTGTGIAFSGTASYHGTPGLGYHAVSWNEFGSDGTGSFAGDGGGADACGLSVTIWN